VPVGVVSHDSGKEERGEGTLIALWVLLRNPLFTFVLSGLTM